MKRTMLTATVLACVTMTATAQEKTPDSAPLPSKIGLIDMAYVFKNYRKFKVLHDDLRVRVEKRSGQANLMAGHIKGFKSALEELDKGSPEYAEAEKQIVQKMREIEDFQKATKRDILKEESQIYRTVYLEVADAVKEHAESHKYTLILRFSREGIETVSEPQEVAQKINKLVVYSRPRDDVTEAVLKGLNERYRQVARRSGALPDVPIAAGKPGTGREKVSKVQEVNPG